MPTEKYKKLFLAEADEKIAALNKALLALEKKPNNVAIATEAMRASHTLKSSAAAMNYMGISHLAHAMEDDFERVRTAHQRLSQNTIDLLFQSVDALGGAVQAIKKGKEEPDTKELIAALSNLAQFPSPGLRPPSPRGRGVGGEGRGGGEGQKEGAVPTIAPIEAIRVDVATLDKLMNLTEELLVEKMRLSEIVRLVKEKPDEKLNRAELESSSDAFDRLISELQLHTTQARMVPLGQIFERFPRMVRDLAKEQGKEAELVLEGQDIELDRTVIDRIGEPLIHLLRNAVDHGIEKKGEVRLKAARERDRVTIAVENIGKPINWERVVEVALRRGIINQATKERYLKEIVTLLHGYIASNNNVAIQQFNNEIVDLLYQVSTKEKVTETSGRGVGLSIVKNVVESLGGKVSVESPITTPVILNGATRSEESRTDARSRIRAGSFADAQDDNGGGGTRFTLQLPLTLAIIQALLVRVAEQTFALPFAQIDRSVRVSRQNIKRAFDQEVAVVEEEDIPMVRLNTLFGIETKRKGLFLSEEEMEKRKSYRES